MCPVGSGSDRGSDSAPDCPKGLNWLEKHGIRQNDKFEFKFAHKTNWNNVLWNDLTIWRTKHSVITSQGIGCESQESNLVLNRKTDDMSASVTLKYKFNVFFCTVIIYRYMETIVEFNNKICLLIRFSTKAFLSISESIIPIIIEMIFLLRSFVESIREL